MAQVCTNSTFTTRNGNKNCVLNSEFLECIVDYNLCSQKQLSESHYLWYRCCHPPVVEVLSHLATCHYYNKPVWTKLTAKRGPDKFRNESVSNSVPKGFQYACLLTHWQPKRPLHHIFISKDLWWKQWCVINHCSVSHT